MDFSESSGRYFDFNIDDEKDKPFGRGPINKHPKRQTTIYKCKEKSVMTPEEKQKYRNAKKESTKKRQEKKRRIIIRNLSFKVEVEELKEILSKYGEVVDIVIPKSSDGKKKGFAFVQFDNFRSSLKAIQDLNFQKIQGRPVAIDYAIAKSKYEHIMSSRNVKEEEKGSDSDDDDNDFQNADIKVEDVESVEDANSTISNDEDGAEDDDDARVSKFMKEFEFNDSENEDSQKEDDEDSDEDSDLDSSNIKKEKNNDECDDAESDGDESDNEHISKKKRKLNNIKQEGSVSQTFKKPRVSQDTQEGKTVFIRNISFETTDESLHEVLAEFGPFSYCLICINPDTELSKGTAFVKFQNKEDADKLIEKSENDSEGVFLDGRRLYCSSALSRDAIQKKMQENVKVKKDKRNLYLLKEGAIMVDSQEAKDMSAGDRSKRTKLEIVKKQKLKNLNFFISKTRLCVHNIPFHYSDSDLLKLFKGVAGRGAYITEARIMKDMNKIDAQNKPKSRGFGFVNFNRHEDALTALKALNNNPTAFVPHRRPIVEFSVESHLALLSKQRRRERNALLNEKKQGELDQNSTKPVKEKGEKFTKANVKKNNKMKKANAQIEVFSPKSSSSKKNKPKKNANAQTEIASPKLSPSKKNKQQKKKKSKKTPQNTSNQNFREMVDSYKTKLLKKM